MGCCGSYANLISTQRYINETQGSENSPPRRLKTQRLLAQKINSINQKYLIIHVLGRDIIGTLFHAKEIQSGVIRTIREINKQQETKTSEIFQDYIILKELDHPNVLKIFETFETNTNYYVVLENISGGPLRDKYKKIWIEGTLSPYIYELFLALNYLHTNKIVHCNICSDNVVLSTDNDEAVLKIIGFSSAQKLDGNKKLNIKEPKFEYSSPEMLTGDYSEKSDIWSAGVLIYYLLTSKFPFPRGSEELKIESIETGKIDYTNSAFQSLSKEAQDLIKMILKKNPNDRPTCSQILQHPWFRESKQALPITYNIAKKLSLFGIKSYIGKCLLTHITFKLSSSKKDYSIINYFKSLDLNGDGKVSREEILNVFTQAGLSVENEIDFIMENLDNDHSGFVDYTELILALTNWNQELKKKNLAKVFVVNSDLIIVEDLMELVPDINYNEWDHFRKDTSAVKGKITLQNFKKYLKKQLKE
jgi:calcium-dependent protein kinase